MKYLKIYICFATITKIWYDGAHSLIFERTYFQQDCSKQEFQWKLCSSQKEVWFSKGLKASWSLIKAWIFYKCVKFKKKHTLEYMVRKDIKET